MKKKISLMAIALMSIGLSSNLKAQNIDVTASATATAEIISVLTISNIANLNFGGIPSPTIETIITMNAADGGVVMSSGSSFASAGALSAAAFQINGEEGYAYSIELPISVTLIGDGDPMIVNNFKHSGHADGTSDSAITNGVNTLYVGADLTIAPAQLAGTYAAATPFNVTISYN